MSHSCTLSFSNRHPSDRVTVRCFSSHAARPCVVLASAGRAVVRSSIWLALLLVASSCASLVSATREGDTAAVAKMLAEGADPNKSLDGQTPLCEAIVQNSVELVVKFVEAGANVNGTCSPDLLSLQGTYTPLVLAARLARTEIMQHLLASGCDLFGNQALLVRTAKYSKNVDAAGITGIYLDHIEGLYGRAKMLEVANHISGSWAPLSAAAYAGDHKMIRQLIARGVDPNGRYPSNELDDTADQWPALYFAGLGSGGPLGAASNALKRAGADPNALASSGRNYQEAIIAKFAADTAREEYAEARRREERAERREREASNAAAFASFSAAMTGGGSSAPISNPVDDNSFQDRMKEIAARPEPRPEPEGHLVVGASDSPTPPPEQAPPPSSSTPPTSTSAGASSSGEAPAATPTCREEPAPQRVVMFEGSSRPEVKSDILAYAKTMCTDAGGDGKVLNNDCSEITLGGSKWIHCKVEIRCNASRRVCHDGKGTATRQ